MDIGDIFPLPLSLKVPHEDSHNISDLFWDVNIEIHIFVENQKK